MHVVVRVSTHSKLLQYYRLIPLVFYFKVHVVPLKCRVITQVAVEDEGVYGSQMIHYKIMHDNTLPRGCLTGVEQEVGTASFIIYGNFLAR